MDIQNIKKNNLPQDKVHKVLAHSYSFYFILLLFGVALDLVYPIRVFNNSLLHILVFVFRLAPLLIIWAQKTGRDLKKVEEKRWNIFVVGRIILDSYAMGLFFLILGFGIIANAFCNFIYSYFFLFLNLYLWTNTTEFSSRNTGGLCKIQKIS